MRLWSCFALELTLIYVTCQLLSGAVLTILTV